MFPNRLKSASFLFNPKGFSFLKAWFQCLIFPFVHFLMAKKKNIAVQVIASKHVAPQRFCIFCTLNKICIFTFDAP